MQFDTNTGTLTIDEFELHDIIAGADARLFQHVNVMATLDTDGNVVERIKIVPKEPEHFTPELVTKWEEGMNRFINMLHGMDAEYHKDAEYTC